MTGMKHALVLASSILMLGAALPALAQPIESEPLPPMNVAPQPSAVPSNAPPASDPGVIPMTSSSGAPVGVKNAPSAASSDMSGGDDGMSGASGGSSAYDLGAPTKAPVGTDSERSGTAAQSVYGTDQSGVTDLSKTDDGDMAPAPGPLIPYGGSIGNAPPAKNSFANKKFCTIKIAFGSRGAGTDEKTAAKIKSFLDSNGANLTYSRVPWGREGEYDLCVDIQQHNNRAKIYSGLKKLVPQPRARADSTGDVTITGAGFTTVTTAP